MSSSATAPRVFVVVGCGEIARNQHVPLIQARPDASLGAIVDIDPDAKTPPEIPVFASLGEAVAACPKLNAAVISTPPEIAQGYIREALEAGLSVFAEKPPGTDDKALSDLEALATGRGLSLFTAYHSTQCPAMGMARRWVEEHGPVNVSFEWKESARKWHGGQEWVKRGYGVLDIVINPISILVELLGKDMVITDSVLLVPENWEAPIAGQTNLMCVEGSGCRISAAYDWTHDKGEIWTIRFWAFDGAVMEVRDGGSQIYIDGERVTAEPTAEDKIRPEYERLYEKFMRLVEKRKSEVIVAPLRIINSVLNSSRIKKTGSYYLV